MRYYGLQDQGSISGKGSPPPTTTAYSPVRGPAQPPIQWVPEALSTGEKWPGRETDHSPLSNAEVKNAWVHTSIPHTFLLRVA
jgi:hypothetical protein